MASNRYSRVAILLHWILAILLLGQIAGGWYMHEFAPISQKFQLYQLHKSFGVLILLLSFCRLAWRLTHRPPALPLEMKRWEAMVAKVTHVLFYVLMIGVPLLGWLMVSASTTGIETKIFKVIPWPNFPGIEPSESLEDLLKLLHKYAAFAMLGLAALHIGAALKHHFINRDAILLRMIPFLKQRG